MLNIRRVDGAGLLPEGAIEAARTGKADGIAAIYRVHASEMLRAATRVTRSSTDAEDIVHDVFVGLPELLRRYEDRGQLGSWLRSVTIGLALDRIRRDYKRKSLLSRFGELLSPMKADASEHQNTHDLNRAVDTLPSELRVVFVLRFFEEQPYEEISSRLEITQGSARVRYLRALRRLRSIMETDR
ncbi:MAG: sigma-70 family RNA polymerase sigma factor [Gemmatimonadaceae bacterium]